MAYEKALQIIRAAFAHVDVERIEVAFDPEAQEDVAKVFVREDQLDEAIGDNGCHPRRAAIEARLAIEIEISDG